MATPAYRSVRMALFAAALGLACNTFAGTELLGVESKFRARIAKEKIRTSAQQRRAEEQSKAADGQASCGSQNIGNIDTDGRGPAPREVFVFAPNAINIVGRGGCR